jgi:hypothetical protein
VYDAAVTAWRLASRDGRRVRFLKVRAVAEKPRHAPTKPSAQVGARPPIDRAIAAVERRLVEGKATRPRSLGSCTT